jgi:Domain of unknown function (DUF3576).
MARSISASLTALLIGGVLLSGCGNRGGDEGPRPTRDPQDILDEEIYGDQGPPSSTIWDIFRNSDPAEIGAVNKYLWNASLDVLSFLPIQSVDPFTGVIVTGYGTPPGGGRAYRATVYITDPALEARSLNLAMQTRSGPVSAATQRAVEDAILTRARQMRLDDANF